MSEVKSLQGSSRWATLLRYGLAVILVALATAGRALLDPYMGDSVPYVTFFLSSAIAIRYTGTGPAVLAILLATEAADYFFMPPRHTLTLAPAQAVTSGVFLLANFVMLALAHAMRKVKEEAEVNAKHAEANANRMNRSQEIAHLGSWELDLVTNRLSWSDEVYRIFGLQPQEFAATYEAFLDAVHPEDRQKVDDAYSGSVREGRDSYEVEHRVIRKGTGEVRIVHERCEHTRDRSGRIISSVGMVHDITERKRVEESFRENKETLALALRSANMGVWRLDIRQSRHYFDEQVCRCLGIDHAQFAGTAEEFYAAVHPSNHDYLKNALDKTIATGAPYEVEYRAVWPDESIHHIAARGQLARDVAGQPERVVGLLWDITERKRGEEALREAQHNAEKHAAELEAIMDAVPGAVFVAHDAECRRISGNRVTVELLGLPSTANFSKSAPEEERPKAVRFLKDGKDIPPEQLPVQMAARGLIVRDYEVDVVCAEGKTCTLLGDAVPLLDKSGQPYGAVGAFVDITQRKQMIAALTKAKEDLRQHSEKLEVTVQERTAKLQELVNELEHFSFTVTHDLRSPLRAMQGFAQMVEDTSCPDCDYKDLLHRITVGARRMDTLITDALNYTKSVRAELELLPVNVEGLLSGMLKSYPNLQPPVDIVRVASARMRDGFPAQGVIFAPEYGSENEH